MARLSPTRIRDALRERNLFNEHDLHRAYALVYPERPMPVYLSRYAAGGRDVRPSSWGLTQIGGRIEPRPHGIESPDTIHFTYADREGSADALRRAKETAAGRFGVYGWKTSPYGHGTYIAPATFEFARAVAAGEIDVRRDISGSGRFIYSRPKEG